MALMGFVVKYAHFVVLVAYSKMNDTHTHAFVFKLSFTMNTFQFVETVPTRMKFKEVTFKK